MTSSFPVPPVSPSPASKSTLYALLVGIGAYERVRQLRGPVGDVQTLTRYLQRQTDFEPNLLVLTDGQASKSAIIDGFQHHLTNATPADTVLFYFSGHGAQEDADKSLWLTEADGKLECLVCHDKGSVNTWDFLLADKELRSLIGEVSATGAHVVVMSDCCHSGDNTRAADLLAEALAGQDTRERRLTKSAPKRPYDGFFFHQTISESQLREQGLDEAMPQGAHVQMAACESDESAVEVNGEGIFTKNLLSVLEASHGQLSYQDLHNRVRQYMRFGYEQRPRVYVAGQGEQTSLLLTRGFLNQPIDESSLTASATYNQQVGWLLDVGAIHGMGQTDQRIQLYDSVAQTSYTVGINRVGTDYTVLAVADDIGAVLDKATVYRATIAGLLLQPIRLHLRNHGGPSNELPDLLDQLQNRQEDNESVKSETFFTIDDEEKNADYTLHLRNGLYYFTRPGDDNRPLIRPLVRSVRVDDDPKTFEQLKQYLHHLSQWQYLKELHNPAVETPVLTIEVTPDGATPIQLQKADSEPLPIAFTEQNGRWTTTLSIRLTNPTDQPVYCTALYLSRDFMSFPDFLPTNYRLEPGQSVTLGLADKKSATGRQTSFRLKLEEVVRQYNWPQSTEYIKLLVTVNPLSETTLGFLKLDALSSPPVLSDRLKPVADRGAFDTDADEADVLPEWSTQTVTLNLVNPLYNAVQIDELNQMLEPPADQRSEDTMADFALGLYYQIETSPSGQPGYKLRDELKIVAPDESQRGLWTDLKAAVANTVARRIQNRQYEQNLIRYPKRKRIVAVGDSWFQYPFLLRDVVDYLSGVYTVFSVSASGATLSDYLKDSTSLEAIAQVAPDFFLLSGGSNDLLGDTFPDLIRSVPDPAKTGPDRYLSDTFTKKMATVGEQYGRLLRLVNLSDSTVNVLIHGYDYIIPVDASAHDNRTSWIGKVLLEKGVSSQPDREAIMRYVIDAFNEQLQRVATAYTNVTYLDLRGTIRRTDSLTDYWYDEIHPNDKGFLSVATKFIGALTKAQEVVR